MATIKQNIDEVKVIKRVKKEIVYEYVPILGEVLGFWRKTNEHKIGEEFCVFLRSNLEKYDRLYINEKEIDISKCIKKEE